MPFSLATPLWLVALVFAAIAPWCVRAFGDAIERNVQRRTIALLNRAGVSPKSVSKSSIEARADRTRTSRGATLDEAASNEGTSHEESPNDEAGVAVNRRGERGA